MTVTTCDVCGKKGVLGKLIGGLSFPSNINTVSVYLNEYAKVMGIPDLKRGVCDGCLKTVKTEIGEVLGISTMKVEQEHSTYMTDKRLNEIRQAYGPGTMHRTTDKGNREAYNAIVELIGYVNLLRARDNA